MTSASNTAASPFQTVSAVDAAEAYLQREVMSGRIVPGQKIKEAPLAASLGISRHTLRAAFARLEAVGLFVYRENRGWSVPVFDQAEYEDVLLLRQSLESSAYRLIWQRSISPDENVQRAVRRVLDVTENVPWAERLEADCELHQALVDLAGSRRLSRAFSAITMEFRLCRLQSLEWLEQLSLSDWKKLHTDLVDALGRRDAPVDAESHFVANPWRNPRVDTESGLAPSAKQTD